MGPASGRSRMAHLRSTGAVSQADTSRLWTYDDKIVGVEDKVAFPDNQELKFEIPKDEEEIEL